MLPLEALLLTPRRGAGVCHSCFNLIGEYEDCYACAHGQQVLDAVVPISYSVSGEPLHRALAGYKRLPTPLALPLRIELASILRRYLELHEACIAREAGTDGFELVTTVPSGDRHRDAQHPLRQLATIALGSARERHVRLLVRSGFETGARSYDFLKYIALRPLDGEPVLLIDDTWTTGASTQSAAAALKAAGAGPVAAVVIGRHVNREWGENDRCLRELHGRFDWRHCALCEQAGLGAPARAGLGDSRAHTLAPRLAMAREQHVGVDRLERIE